MKSVLIAFAFVASPVVLAAGYDCRSNNLTAVEKMICSDPHLSQRDEVLSQLFDSLRRVSSADERSMLRAQQGAWLRNARDRCTLLDCLAQAYEQRFAELVKLYDDKRDQIAEETWAQVSPDVRAELARRSNFPEPELKKMLGNCDWNQVSMNICAFRDLIEADLEMKRALQRAISSLPESCRPAFESRQSTWEASRESKCDFKGGSIVGMLRSRCMASMTVERTSALAKVTSCNGIR